MTKRFAENLTIRIEPGLRAALDAAAREEERQPTALARLLVRDGLAARAAARRDPQAAKAE